MTINIGPADMNPSRNIVLYTALTLDGYIARADGSIDWLDPFNAAPDGGDYGYRAFVDTIDTTLMGRKTFDLVRSFEGPFPYSGLANYVYTRSPQTPSHPDVRFVTSDIAAHVAQLGKNPGKNIWLVGGGQLNAVLLKAGLIDEFILTYIPIVLGGGIPLFHPAGTESSYTLIDTLSWSNGVVQMKLRRKEVSA